MQRLAGVIYPSDWVDSPVCISSSIFWSSRSEVTRRLARQAVDDAINVIMAKPLLQLFCTDAALERILKLTA